jgi:hypothetical protein
VSIHQARKTPHPHSHCEILALHIAGADGELYADTTATATDAAIEELAKNYGHPLMAQRAALEVKVNAQPNSSTPRQSLVQIRRMWEGGPLREIYVGPHISRKQRAPGNFMLNAQGLYVGAYVCDHCGTNCEGLYEAATPSTSAYWLCRGCKEGVTTKREQPAQLRRALRALAASA